MTGATDLLKSERGIFALLLVVIATALVMMKYITGADWISFAKWLGAALIFAKTVSGFTAPQEPAEATP